MAAHGDAHDEVHEGPAPGHSHAPAPPHPHRTLPAIRELILRSALPDPVKASAVRIFTRLAEAEGRVHGASPDTVQFHDVGAVDAIVDIVGACIGLHRLGIDTVHCSALPLGGGTVSGPHGRIPVPAPGTAELLKGFPVVDTGVKRELVTPTGAAILTTLAAGAGRMPPMTVEAVGYGAGTMDLDTPNVIRLFVGAGLRRRPRRRPGRAGDRGPGRDHGGRHVAPALRPPHGAPRSPPGRWTSVSPPSS